MASGFSCYKERIARTVTIDGSEGNGADMDSGLRKPLRVPLVVIEVNYLDVMQR